MVSCRLRGDPDTRRRTKLEIIHTVDHAATTRVPTAAQVLQICGSPTSVASRPRIGSIRLHRRAVCGHRRPANLSRLERQRRATAPSGDSPFLSGDPDIAVLRRLTAYQQREPEDTVCGTSTPCIGAMMIAAQSCSGPARRQQGELLRRSQQRSKTVATALRKQTDFCCRLIISNTPHVYISVAF